MLSFPFGEVRSSQIKRGPRCRAPNGGVKMQARISRSHETPPPLNIELIGQMKTYSTILSQYSLAAVDIGKPIGEPSVTKFNSGKKALLALHAAIKGNSKFQVFLIGTPDGREIPFDQAYFEVFGERPVFRDGVANGYPRLK